LGVCATSLLVAACQQQEAPNEPTRGPSVLLVTIDTLRADHLGAYGYPEPVSPQIDALAARGVVYERAIAASSRTAPSHASILTSRWVRDHSIAYYNGYSRLGGEPTLAAVFRAHRYATAAFVSNGVLSQRMGLTRGFDRYDDELPEQERNRLVFERTAQRTTERALAWLADARAPWFVWVHYNDPHGPYTPPPPYDQGASFSGVARGAAVAVPERRMPVIDDPSGAGGLPAYQKQGDLLLPRDYRRRYAAEIRYLDDWLGRLAAGAEAVAGTAGLVLVLTADHGESHGEDGVFFSHGTGTMPDVVHVPLIVKAPGLAPGRSRDLVHHVDVLPTILELAGLPARPDASGTALARHWRAGTPVPERVLFADVGREVSGYRGDHIERSHVEQDGGVTRGAFRWRADGGWEAAAVQDDLRARVESYAAREVSALEAPPPSAEEIERLRALGYVVSEGDAPADTAR
jgi:arylsulfatase